MDVSEVKTVRLECEQAIRELLNQLETKTGMFVEYVSHERLGFENVEPASIAEVKISLSLDGD